MRVFMLHGHFLLTTATIVYWFAPRIYAVCGRVGRVFGSPPKVGSTPTPTPKNNDGLPLQSLETAKQ